MTLQWEGPRLKERLWARFKARDGNSKAAHIRVRDQDGRHENELRLGQAKLYYDNINRAYLEW